ncbi:MBL fold metallo-hydrolase [Peptoniphilus catoniae]|uniref:MBL fold metallo-hydrolase n=1 Tax=Peptoniphilus catoniae TaxID=1660341 RepID=UPI0010FD1EBC|nr:MBL fold metallo-hydrolase [Peptoniphilus catoniae]
MRIQFIKHSCYTVESENYYLVFDYIGGNLNIPENKKLIFFVSHRHSDHFSEKIFDFKADAYVISDDVEIPLRENMIFIGPDEEKEVLGLKVISHGSTDEGVSFYVDLEGKGIIHSGDLNYWMWDHYTEKDIEEMDRWFKSEVDKFKPYSTYVVMMPVDPRLNQYYDLTADYFLKTIEARHFFPMHMWEDFNISKRLKDKYQSLYPEKIIHEVKGDGEVFDL